MNNNIDDSEFEFEKFQIEFGYKKYMLKDKYKKISIKHMCSNNGKIKTTNVVDPDSGLLLHEIIVGFNFENNTEKFVAQYQNGMADGLLVAYGVEGNVCMEGEYVNGKKHGMWHYYNEKNELREHILYYMDKEIGSYQTGTKLWNWSIRYPNRLIDFY